MSQLYLGIDLGGTNIKAGLCDPEGNILEKQSVKTGKERPYGEIIADMAALCRRVCESAGHDFGEIEGIGIGSPGTVDSRTGSIFYANNLRWHDVPVGKTLSALLDREVFVTNDANAAALGEARFGAGRAFSSSVLLTLGTGVGGGVVLDGKLFEGFRSAGAEVGHMIIRMDGESCTCGLRGCLEAYASATALIRDTRRAMDVHPESAMWKIAPSLEAVDGRTAFAAAREGDAAAREVVQNYIHALATGIIALVNVLRPEAVIVGGGVCAEGDYLLDPLKKQVYEGIYGGDSYAPLQILRAERGNDAGLLGAAAYAKDRMTERK